MSEKLGDKFLCEIDAEENVVVREIIQEIMNFGVSQRQIIYLIYLLALHLESKTEMDAIVDVVRFLRSDTFIVDREEDDN